MALVLWTCVLLLFCARAVDLSKGKSCVLPRRNNIATFHGTKHVFKPGETLSYSCKPTFRPTSNITVLTCMINRKWNPPNVECEMIKCEKFTIANGKLNTGRLKFNTKVNIACHAGYRLRGPSVVTCGANSSWIPSLPTCEKEVTCPPPVVPNSSRQSRYKVKYDVGEHVNIFCEEGFELIGSSQVTCGADGQWKETPQCRLSGGECPPPPFFPNAHTEQGDQRQYEPGTTVRFKCNHGYRMIRGSSTIHCRNGRWTDLQMTCEKKSCRSAGEIVNGRYHYTGSSFGDTATANCKDGYRLVGVAVRHCTANGWDGRVAVCEAVQCPEPPTVPDADLYLDAGEIIKHGDLALYKCRHGSLSGASEIFCTEDGTWSAPAPRCEVVTCPSPTIMSGIIVSGVRLQYKSGHSVTIKCKPRWRLLGPDVITCGADGSWDPRLPQCVY